jgi:hypothetical protein
MRQIGSYFFICIYFLLISISGISKDVSDSTIQELQTPFYISLSDSLTLRFLVVNKFNSFEIRDRSTDKDVDFAPNSDLKLGVGFNYKKIGLNILVNLPGVSVGKSKGESTYFDFNLTSYGRKFGFDIAYNKYNGYYWSNPKQIIVGYKDSHLDYPQRPDISTGILAVSGYFNVNHKKFSYLSSFSQNERQLVSAGSPIIGAYANVFGLSSTDSLTVLPEVAIPEDDPELYFDEDLHFKSIQTRNIGVSGGYIYSFIIQQNFFITLSLQLGMGVESTDVTYANQPTRYLDGYNIFGVSRAAFGYNGTLDYIGISAFSSNFLTGSTDDLNVRYNLGSIRLIYAHRFSAGFIRRILKK